MRTKVFAALAIALGVTVLVPTLAFGHADYESSTPNDGETVTSSPAQVVATFEADLDPAGTNTLNVKNASGADVDNNDSTISASNEMTITLQPSLPSGTYTVEWATTSAEDGEDDDGTFTFTIAAASSGGSTATPSASGAPSTGSGPDEGGSGMTTTLVLLALTVVGTVALGGSAALRVRANRD